MPACVSYSLNEVDALAKKAARGAGFDWGLAEEAGKATRWLCQNAIDGCSVLANALQRMDGVAHEHFAPKMQLNRWCSTRGILCPLSTGAALSDNAVKLNESALVLERIAEPGLLIFFAAQCARRLDESVTLSWQDMSFTTDGIELQAEPGDRLNALMGVHDVRVSLQGSLQVALRSGTRATPASNAWQKLNEFAGRTYAPATEESRLKGAGAGLSDSD